MNISSSLFFFTMVGHSDLDPLTLDVLVVGCPVDVVLLLFYGKGAQVLESSFGFYFFSHDLSLRFQSKP